MRLEKANAPVIKAALTKSRNFMVQGNRKSAVAALEAIQSLVSYTTDIGGEVLLDLGMALETVDRIDDARIIYGKLGRCIFDYTSVPNTHFTLVCLIPLLCCLLPVPNLLFPHIFLSQII
jgi:hypothetical protein